MAKGWGRRRRERDVNTHTSAYSGNVVVIKIVDRTPRMASVFRPSDVDSNEPLVSHLRSKYAEKPWNETIQLVRRCMDKSRSDPRSSQLLLSCLERLHGALNVSSLMSMVSKLEMIAKQRGLGSHLSPTETTCYLTSDLFYLEVLLLPSGDVEDVKVAHHGEAPVSCEPLLKLLRSKRYEDFSLKLDCLSSLYNIPGTSTVFFIV
ncbi:hypothetical protein AGOR_G00177090 [Albula goreensis]|uniref:Mediator of RNA polymerase II transcription subunit 1 n=1 Tax=Albula goreensis TaxID=1534307 RepID=A0A8T3D3N8_9TELE|nr:hypothetical protein AGOR_G00177090 [Albula goreensis]